MKHKYLTFFLALLLFSGVSNLHASEIKTLFSESFASGQGEFTIVNTNLPNELTYLWHFDASYGMSVSAYANGQAYNAESWLISPAIDLSRCGSAYVTYSHAAKFQNGNEDRGITVWAAVNPNIEEINENEWTQLQVPSYPVKGTWAFSSTGQISLQEFVANENVMIAIRYNATTIAADSYEMKEFSVVGIIGQTYTITAQADDPMQGSVIGGGVYMEEATATLIASPKEEYNFDSWNDGNISAKREITVTSDSTFTAYFKPVELITIQEALNIGSTLSLTQSYGSNSELLLSDPTENKYYLTGKVSNVEISIDSEHNEYLRATFDLTDASGTMSMYNAKGIAGAAVTFRGQIQENDSVTILGKIQKVLQLDSEGSYTTKVEFVSAYLVYQNNKYINADGVVYRLSPDGISTVTNYYNLGEEVALRDSLRWDNRHYPTKYVVESALKNTSIKILSVPATIDSIGALAFNNCASLETVISVSPTPPTANASSFEGISNFICTLFVPKESIDTYKNAIGWNVFQFVKELQPCKVEVAYDEKLGAVEGDGSFTMGDHVHLIATPRIGYRFAGWSDGKKVNPYDFTAVKDVQLDAYFELVNAEKVQLEHDEVVIEPAATTANIIWPAEAQAARYELIIKTNNVELCTLVFDASGKLMEIAFHKPARNKETTSQQETQIEGFSFTITGLEKATKYNYTLVAKDANNIPLETYSGVFYTEGYQESITYTVIFCDWDGSVLKQETVAQGENATPPANPTRDGFTFTGWDKDFTNVQSDLTVTAQYKSNSSGEEETTYYTVKFVDWDDTILKKQTVEKGKNATPPDDPVRSGYTFKGWDKEFTNVQSDLVVKAVYEKNPDEAIDEILESSNLEILKFLRNGQLYILRNGEVYNAQGARVE